jgi:L-ribulose-5-phosphate 4-epimerase
MSNADIRQLREDLVTCTRLLVQQEILDYSGHLSARVPGSDELVLVQPRDTSRAALSPDDLLIVDLEGNLVEGDGIPVAETAIHTGVYRARPDVNVVCHGHPTMSTAFSVVDTPLVPVRHFAYKNPNGLPIHPDPTHIVTNEQGDALAKTLGQGNASLMRSHGTVVVSTRIQELFMDCVDLEENARTLLYARQLGGTVSPLDAAEVDVVEASYARSRHRPDKFWNHYIYKGRAAGVL